MSRHFLLVITAAALFTTVSCSESGRHCFYSQFRRSDSLLAANGNGINDGFRGVQVKFSENDAIGFLNSCNNIFGTNFKIRK
jgi:hypothetical protein